MDLVEELLEEWRDNGLRWERAADRVRSHLGLQVWNPAIYAFDAYSRFLRKFPPRKGAILALGLNPGPYGMAQTGIPFTDCRTARVKLGLPVEIPGSAPADLSTRLKKANGRWRGTYERSSLGVYRFLESAWKTLPRAFENWYVGNPCPLLFLDPAGWNVTPADPRLRRIEEMAELRIMALRRFHGVLRSRGIVCLGRDVAQILGNEARLLVGPERVIEFEHPARAVPDSWAAKLKAEIEKRELLRGGSR